MGYQINNNPEVLSIFECKKFEQQTLISAIPHAQEFQEISSVLPQGIGPIGIYHSHPFSSKIFHSHTDDSTLVSLNKQFPNSLSIVTNGKELNCYQIDKHDKTHNIELNYVKPKIPRFLLIEINREFKVKIHKNFLKSNGLNSLKIKLLNKFKNFLEDIWPYLKFYYHDSEVSFKDKIYSYLVNNLKSSSIKIKFPIENQIEDYENQILINDEDPSSNLKEKDFQIFKLRLKAKTPIYITENDNKLNYYRESIKTELISNNLLQKLYNSYINFDNKTIILPQDVFIRFFGFYIKIMLYKNANIREEEFINKNNRFLLKLLSFIKSMIEIDLNKNTKKEIADLLEDLEIIAKTYNFDKNVSKKVENLIKII